MIKKLTKVALVIPAYNEEAVVAAVINDLHKVFEGSAYEAHVIVVDDGSSDATPEVAEKAGAHVIRHILNSGSGSATATGLSYAQAHGFTVAATLDADGQHQAHDVLRGVDLLVNGGADLLIGSRIIDTQASHMSLLKTIGNKGLSFITFLLFGINVTDSQSGLRIFSERALKDLKWKTSGYEFCSEMLWRAKQLGLTVAEYPIKAIYTDYSVSKPGRQNNWNGFNIVKVLLRQRIVELFSE
ncbi:MAG TPA: glycosyltransferase family 2 protein [Candidatus Saccharimonadales bacterium]|nr:glycosyltransferase family 2 protein [Candidatus Saccharimonadales bacterium]